MMKHIGLYKTQFLYFKFYLRQTFIEKIRISFKRRKQLIKTHSKIYSELHNNGYVVIENYATADMCKNASVTLKSFIRDNPEFVHKNDDQRVFGVENFIRIAKDIFVDSDFLDIAEIINREPSYSAFSLGGWLESGTNASSGGGWHRDAFYSQFKAMLYLTDVTDRNGPFELLPGSHKLSTILSAQKDCGIDYMQDRFTEDEVKIIEFKTGVYRKKLIGKAGTLVLFNSSTIHQGSPIIEGERLSITNYYFPISRDKRSVFKQFSPVVVFFNNLDK